ncbi:DNRLRE domain-containing protein [Massilia sp. HP4]|uniref:DNRLRE domain-containing protein n=1 Tax=Massilia sp. HP4 TaxID=2562316 RepID=UPI0010C105BB|nr:DNRLRE domain-containing protein [Massilia sp. HP4]
MTRRRQHGAVLLMVAIVLATVAALAVGVNRLASTESRAAQGDYESRAAVYLADAGMAAARWKNQVAGCTSDRIAPTALGAGTFTAEVPAVKGTVKKIDIAASGVVNGVTLRTLERKQVTLHDLSKAETVKLTEKARDITIDRADDDTDDDDKQLWLEFDSAHALLYWAMGDIKKDALVLSATLALTPDGSNGAGAVVAVQRLMTPWEDDASWKRPHDDDARWDGGNYLAQPAATTTVAGATIARWDVTELVNGWFGGQFPNHGMLLRLTNPGPSVRFHSLDASSSRHPVLQVLSARRC